MKNEPRELFFQSRPKAETGNGSRGSFFMIEITKEKIFEHFEIFLRDCMKQEKLMQQSAFSHFSSVVYRKILLLLGQFYFLLGQSRFILFQGHL